MLLGIAYRRAGSQELMGEAIAEFRQALALNPASCRPASIWRNAISIWDGRQRARRNWKPRSSRAPGNPQFLALLGEAERQLKNPRRAIELTRQALQADQSFAQARYYLGLALLDLGQRDEAIRSWSASFSRVRRSPTRISPGLRVLSTPAVSTRR